MKTYNRVIVAGALGCVAGSILTAQVVRGQGSDPLQGSLSHISFAVRDVDKTARDFGALFGVEAGPSTTYRDVPWGPRFGDKVMHGKVVGFAVNGVRFEFIEPLDGESPWKDFIEEKGEGVHHIGFSVADVQLAREALEAKGGTWVQDYMGFAAYVDMHPVVPITFEITPGAPGRRNQ